jgi:glutamine amidotransferase
MCVAIYIPAGATVAENILRGVFRRNDDGVGVAWSDGSKLDIWRTMNDINGVVSLVASLRDYPVLVHFRYATHGTVTMDNVHPFWLDERRRAVVAHNGVIQIGIANNESDTRSFVRNVLGQMKDGWWNNPTTVSQIEKLTNGSRVVIMEDDGRPHFLNKLAGETSADNVWFSNSQWKEFVDPTAKSLHASMILAETGERKAYTHGTGSAYAASHGSSQSDFWHRGDRDPFQSASATKSLPATSEPKKTTSTSAGGTTATPVTTPSSSSSASSKTTNGSSTPSSASSTSTTGSTHSAKATVTAIGRTTTGPVTQSEVAEWIKAFGQTLVAEYGVGYAAMPDGAYGHTVCYCNDCVPSFVEDGRAAFTAMVTAICLLDGSLSEMACVTCQTPMADAARAMYADAFEAAEAEHLEAEDSTTDDPSWLEVDLPTAHAQADGATATTEEQKTAMVSGSAMADFPYSD